MRSTLPLVMISTPLFSSQRCSIELPTGVIIERRICPARPAITDSCTPLWTSDFMHTPATKPAPSMTTRLPGLSFSAIARASSSVQQVTTPGRSWPGTGGMNGVEPVAVTDRALLLDTLELLR